MFEPNQPKDAVYMAPSPNCMGLLLLQNKKRKKSVVPNPAVGGLNLVYTPSEGSEADGEMVLKDLSGLPIRFQSIADFTKEEKITR